DAFAVLFFVAVGMLFDPMVLVRDPLPILATVFIIVIGKSVLAYFIVTLFRRAVGTALTISASLAQIGEFSFILATLGVSLGVLPTEARDLILAGAILSIILNPVMFWLVDALRPRLEARSAEPAADGIGPIEPELEPSVEPAYPAAEAASPTRLSGHTVLIGYGRVGTVVAEGLLQAGRPFVLIEDAEGRISAAHAAGIEVIAGNAAAGEVLELANVAGAGTVIIAIPNAFEAGQAAEQCRQAAGDAVIIARAHSDEEEDHLRHLGADMVIMGEREIAMAMLERIAEAQPAPAAVPEPAAAEASPAAVAKVPGTAIIRRPARHAAQPYETEAGSADAAGGVPEVLPEPAG